MPRALKRLRNLGNRHTATVQGLRLPLLCRSKLGPSAALVPTCPCCEQPCHHTLPYELPLKFGTHTQAVTGRLSTTPETHSVSTGESALADYIWPVKLVCRKLTLLLVKPRRSISMVGRDIGACHTVNMTAPLRTNVPTYGDCAKRYKKRSMAKYCNISLN